MKMSHSLSSSSPCHTGTHWKNPPPWLKSGLWNKWKQNKCLQTADLTWGEMQSSAGCWKCSTCFMSWQDGEIKLKLLRGVWLNIQTLIFSCLLKTACLCLLPVPCLSSLPARHSSGLPRKAMETQSRGGDETQNTLPVEVQVSCTAAPNLMVLIKVPFYIIAYQSVSPCPMSLVGRPLFQKCYSQLSPKPVTFHEENLYGTGVYLLDVLDLLASPEKWSEQCSFSLYFLSHRYLCRQGNVQQTELCHATGWRGATVSYPG